MVSRKCWFTKMMKKIFSRLLTHPVSTRFQYMEFSQLSKENSAGRKKKKKKEKISLKAVTAVHSKTTAKQTSSGSFDNLASWIQYSASSSRG